MDNIEYLKSAHSAIYKSQAILNCSPEGVITSANELLLDKLGYKFADIEGQSYETFVGNDTTSFNNNADFWSMLQNGKAAEAEFAVRKNDGNYEWVNISGTPIIEPEGAFAEAILFFRFTTQSKFKIDDYAGQIKAIGLSQAVVEFNMDGTIISANELFLREVGYTLEQIQGRHHSMFVDPDHAESAAYRQFWSDLSAGDYKSGEFKRIGKDNKEIWLQASYTPILDFNDRLFKVVKYATFITEQKLVSADYESQITAIGKSQAVVEFKMDGTIITANPFYLDAIGYSLAEVRGRHHRFIIDTQSTSAESYEAFWRSLNRGEYQSGEYKRTSKSGEPVWIQGFYTPVLDLNGHPFKVVKYATIITDKVLNRIALKNTQIELERHIEELNDARAKLQRDAKRQVELSEDLAVARDAAESANLTKSAFLATMSHEIRTPMTGVMGFADLLLQDDLDPDSREKVFSIKESTQALLQIINGILDLSKLEAGKVEIKYINFNLRGLIEEILKNLKTSFGADKFLDVDLSFDISADVPEVMNLDPTRTRQLLFNLLSNALKFTQTGSVSLKCGILSGENYPTRMLKFEVSDTGIGIREDNIDLIFKDFSQADTSLTRRYDGTGLGLPICKNIVGLLGGELGVESEHGEGSTFWFVVPLRPKAIANNEDDLPAQDKPIQYAAEESLKVLIAEDNAVNQRIIRSIIEGFGHYVTVVEDGEAACLKASEEDFDLILMDIRMPILSGIDATKKIRAMSASNASVPIIAITADVISDHKKEYLEAGMNAIVAKPIELGVLVKAIDDVIGKPLHMAVRANAINPKVANIREYRRQTQINNSILPDVQKFLESIK